MNNPEAPLIICNQLRILDLPCDILLAVVCQTPSFPLNTAGNAAWTEKGREQNLSTAYAVALISGGTLIHHQTLTREVISH